jgi:hypothetical protein
MGKKDFINMGKSGGKRLKADLKFNLFKNNQ